MVRKVKGFSLIEVLVVLAIMGIIILLGIPSYKEWKDKAQIEGKTKKLAELVKKAKAKAFTEKKRLSIEKIEGNKICIREGSTNIDCLSDLENFTLNRKINISNRGIATKATIYYNTSNNAIYDCVVVNTITVKVDKCNGLPKN